MGILAAAVACMNAARMQYFHCK